MKSQAIDEFKVAAMSLFDIGLSLHEVKDLVRIAESEWLTEKHSFLDSCKSAGKSQDET
jgi:hypothetical protein